MQILTILGKRLQAYPGPNPMNPLQSNIQSEKTVFSQMKVAVVQNWLQILFAQMRENEQSIKQQQEVLLLFVSIKYVQMLF